VAELLETFESGRLARAIGTDDIEDFTLSVLEADAVHGDG